MHKKLEQAASKIRWFIRNKSVASYALSELAEALKLIDQVRADIQVAADYEARRDSIESTRQVRFACKNTFADLPKTEATGLSYTDNHNQIVSEAPATLPGDISVPAPDRTYLMRWLH